MAKVFAVIIIIACICPLALGQTLGIKVGSLFTDGVLITQRMEASFSNPVTQDLEVTVATGLLTALARSNSGYAVPLAGGLKYTFMENIFSPYCGLEYGGDLNVRRNAHSRFSSVLKFGLGIQYPLQEMLLLDVSTKYVTNDFSGYEFMAGIRFRL
jgi:hypothetical protein